MRNKFIYVTACTYLLIFSIHADDSDLFKSLEGKYICNKAKDIFGFDPIAKYFSDERFTNNPIEVCNGKCKQVNSSSLDLDHVLVEIKTSKQVPKIHNTATYFIEYEVFGSFSKELPRKKTLEGVCSKNGENGIWCDHEDKDITLNVFKDDIGIVDKEIGMPKSDIDLYFYRGGYGLTNYTGLSLTGWIGNLFCKRLKTPHIDQ